LLHRQWTLVRPYTNDTITLWTGEGEDPEVKTAYQYVMDLRERVEETCELGRNELAKVQTRNQRYYNRRTHNMM